MNALVEKYEIKMCDKVWMIFVNLYSKDQQRAPTITSSCVGARSLSLSSLSQRNAVTAWKTSPLDRSKRFTLFASPGRPVHSDTNSASPESILARQQLRAKGKTLTFPPLSIARYSFIQLSEHQWRERKCPIFETVDGLHENVINFLSI